MASSSRPFPERERADLADLLEELGPDAPTCCAGWTTAHLAAHLVVRDRRPDALVGYGAEEFGLAGPLASWSHRLEDRLRETTPYAEVVRRVRSGPAPWSPLAWPVVAQVLNVTEYAIHHEDVRRAHPRRGTPGLPPPVHGAPGGVGTGLDGRREVPGRARSPAGDHRHTDLAPHSPDELGVEAGAGAVGVHRVE